MKVGDRVLFLLKEVSDSGVLVKVNPKTVRVRLVNGEVVKRHKFQHFVCLFKDSK